MASSVTQEEVFASIEALLERGECPHCLNVRRELGGRGSGPAVSRMIGAWYEKYGPSITNPEPPSSMVQEAFRDVIAAFDISALRTDENPGATMSDAIMRIGTTLAQLYLVMDAWEADLARRDVAMAARWEVIGSPKRVD